jgi:hypothetical protein
MLCRPAVLYCMKACSRSSPLCYQTAAVAGAAAAGTRAAAGGLAHRCRQRVCGRRRGLAARFRAAASDVGLGAFPGTRTTLASVTVLLLARVWCYQLTGSTLLISIMMWGGGGGVGEGCLAPTNSQQLQVAGCVPVAMCPVVHRRQLVPAGCRDGHCKQCKLVNARQRVASWVVFLTEEGTATHLAIHLLTMAL